MNNRVSIGIDPGTTGCVCQISAGGSINFWDTPCDKVKVGKKVRAVYDIAKMASILREAARLGAPLVTIEEIHAMPKNGGCGNFSSGYGYGVWLALLTSLGIPFQTVQPAAWKKALGLKKPAGEKITDSAKKAADKQFACRLFPSAASQMALVKHHGRADSLLIAEYGRRSFSNGVMESAAIYAPAVITDCALRLQ